jgi:hypothetical protein
LLAIRNHSVPISGVEKSPSWCNTFPKATYYGVEKLKRAGSDGMRPVSEIGGVIWSLRALALARAVLVAVGRLFSSWF